MKKKTNENFINEVVRIHGNKYDYSKLVYTGIFEEITIICPVHGEFQQKAHDHIRGHGCPKCAREEHGKRRNEKAKENFIKEATKRTNGKYDLSEVEYIDAKTKVKVICNEKDECGEVHGPFYITPSNLLSLYGCPKCGRASTTLKNRLPYEDYQASIDKKFGNGVYTVDESSYRNNTLWVTIHCNIHNKDFIVHTRNFPRNVRYRCKDCLEDVKLVPRLTIKNHQIDRLQQPELNESIKKLVEGGEEVWIPVRGYENYMVSSEGRVKKINRLSRHGNPLPDYFCHPIINKNTRRVEVVLNGKHKSIHKTVFESFYNLDIPKGYEYTIDHLDTNPLNNSLLNLRLCNGIIDNMLNNPLTMLHMFKENKNKGNSLLFDIDEIEGEIWKPCRGYEGLYSVSNMGRVKAEKRLVIEKNTGRRRIKRPHLMKLFLKDGRSYSVGLIDFLGQHKNHFVHRLEYEAFIGEIPEGFEIDHIDSNPQNNVLSNIRACSHTENSNNPNSKRKRVSATTLRGVKINLINKEGRCIEAFNSIHECAKQLKVHETTIMRIINGISTGKRTLKEGERLIRPK